MNIRSSLLGAIVAFAGLFGFASASLADTYTGTVTLYNGQTVNGLTVGPHSSGLAGEIVLTNGVGTGSLAGLTSLATWCLDIFHDIYLGYAYTWTVQPIVTGVLVAPPLGNPPLSTVGLDAAQIREIGALMQYGQTAANLSGDGSAAIQLAIWEIEYGLSASGPSGVVSLASTLKTDAINNTGGLTWFSNWEVLQRDDGQILAFIAPPGHQLLTPLPGALPLFATGLGVLAFVTKRKKKKAATAVA